MPTPPFDFNVQNNFPQAAVIQAAQQNAQRQLEAQQAGQGQLVQGLQAIGQVGQSLLDRRRAMAQAMAGAQLYANSPEGKEMMGTNQVTTGPQGQPVTMDQTAQGAPNQAPTPNKPSIDLQTLATAFMGDKPSDVMSQMFERHKLNVQSGLESQRIAQEGQIRNLLASLQGKEVAIKGQEVSNQITHTTNQDINDLLARRDTIIKSLPTGWWSSLNNPQAEAAKSSLADIDTQLQAKGYNSGVSGNPPPTSQNIQKTPRFGATYTVNISGQP